MPIRLAFRAPKFVLENPVVYLSDEEPCVIYLNFILLLPHIGHILCVGFSFAALERAKKQHTARPIEKKKAKADDDDFVKAVFAFFDQSIINKLQLFWFPA